MKRQPTGPSAGHRIREGDLQKLTPGEQRYYQARLERDPPRSMKEAGAHLGLSYGRACAYWHEIKKKIGYDPLEFGKDPGGHPRKESELEVMARIAPGEFNRLLELRMDQILRHMTPAKMADAKLGELARSVRELGQQRQVIRTEAPRALTAQSRVTLNNAMMMLVQEAARRGIELRTNPQTGEVEVEDKQPPEPEQIH